MPLTEGEQRLAVAGEHAPDLLLAVAVEVGVDADLAGDRPRDGLVVLGPVVLLLAHAPSVDGGGTDATRAIYAAPMSTRTFGAQSMVAPLRDVLVKRPAEEFGRAFDDPATGYLHAVDYASNAARTSTFGVHWFSDGGICSNLPIHFFDQPLPLRPTFAIDLAR